MLVAAGILVAKLNRHCHFFQSLTKKKLFLITTHERAWQLNSPTSLGNCRHIWCRHRKILHLHYCNLCTVCSYYFITLCQLTATACITTELLAKAQLTNLP